MAYTPVALRQTLDELKKKNRTFMTPQPYQNFLPLNLTNRPPANEEAAYSNLTPIEQRGQIATATEQTYAQNQAMIQAVNRAQNQAQVARQNLRGLIQGQPTYRGPQGGGVIDLSNVNINLSPRMVRRIGGRIGASGNVNLGRIRPGDPNAGVIHAQGHTTRVSGRYAPLFQGFLNALTRKGYKIHSLGGYANRNIAGTNTRSLHSYGLAIDINPAQNPVSYGHMTENMPPGIRRLAARYGLVWGGAWQGGKKDPMHFSIPYRGTK
jgi:hypothetical protein